jgi:predicted RNA-binding protein Jag
MLVEQGTQLYVLRSDTYAQMIKSIRELLVDAFPEDRAALTEAETAINEVLEHNKPVELAPQRARLRRLQHELAKHYGLLSKSKGEEPFRRLVVYPA